MNFLIIWSRISAETNIKKLIHLSDFLNVSQQFVSKKKKENIFPIEWAYKIAKEYNLITEWILTGEGPKRLEDLSKGNDYHFQVLRDFDQWLSELVVGEPHRKDWAKACLEDAFPMFREWMKRKEEQENKNTDIPGKNVA